VSEDGLDPVIHAPARLRIMVTLAALADGDNLSFTRLQDLIGLTPGNLITHLRKLEDAGYVTAQKNGAGVTARTSIALSHTGRAALDRYTTVLRQLLDSAYQDAELQLGEAWLQHGQSAVDAAEGRGVDRAL
jgi:DNA-binding transcriptional ArsR family regulator